MDDAFIVRAGKRAGDLDAVAQDGFGRQAAVTTECAQGFAFDQFHHDVEFAVGFADFVDRADIGMSEG